MRRTPFSCNRWSKKSALVKPIDTSVRGRRFRREFKDGLLSPNAKAETYRVTICLPSAAPRNNGRVRHTHRIAVVTGGSAGVGRATARAFARGGLHVAVIARGEDRLAATKTELEALGVKCVAISAD